MSFSFTTKVSILLILQKYTSTPKVLILLLITDNVFAIQGKLTLLANRVAREMEFVIVDTMYLLLGTVIPIHIL